MPAFEYRQAEEVRDALQRHGVEYLFIGKSGAILLGFPDTTQDAYRRHVDVEGFPVCHLTTSSPARIPHPRCPG